MADELGSYQLVISELQAIDRLCASTRLSASTKCEPTLCIVQRHLADEAGLLQAGQLKPHEWVSIELSAPNCWSIDPSTKTCTNIKLQIQTQIQTWKYNTMIGEIVARIELSATNSSRQRGRLSRKGRVAQSCPYCPKQTQGSEGLRG